MQQVCRRFVPPWSAHDEFIGAGEADDYEDANHILEKVVGGKTRPVDWINACAKEAGQYKR